MDLSRRAILAFAAARCASIRSRFDSAFASSATSGSRAAEGESFRDRSSPGAFTRRFPNSSFGSRRKRELPGSRENFGLAMTSREWIQHLHVRLSEIVRVSGDDDEIVNERGRCDQAVLYRHRFTGLAKLSQKFCPTEARERIPCNADDSCDALIKPGFESTTSL